MSHIFIQGNPLLLHDELGLKRKYGLQYVFPDVPMRNPNAPVDARAPCEAWQRRGDARSIHPPEPLPTAQLQALRRWLRGEIAMRPEEARERLARAIDARQLVDEPATHWRAVKAWIAGDDNWAQMGFRLVLD